MESNAGQKFKITPGLIIVAIVVLYFAMLLRSDWLIFSSLSEEKGKLRDATEAATAKRVKLKEEIAELNDPRYIELVARAKAILRRAQAGVAPQQTIDVCGIHIDILKREVLVEGKSLTLRTKEFDLLAVFAQNPGVVLSRERLLNEVWGYDYYGETRTVDVHINHLRDKLEGSSVDIETFRGTGYKMVGHQEPR